MTMRTTLGQFKFLCREKGGHINIKEGDERNLNVLFYNIFYSKY